MFKCSGGIFTLQHYEKRLLEIVHYKNESQWEYKTTNNHSVTLIWYNILYQTINLIN